MERHYGRVFHSLVLSPSVLLHSLNQNPSSAYIYINSLSLVYNYEGKTKKSYSSFCRGPLMISLKWLTALKSVGKLPQSKQIWSVLETEAGASLGEGWNTSACINQGEVAGVVNEEDLERGGDSKLRCRQMPPPILLPSHHLIPSVLRCF